MGDGTRYLTTLECPDEETDHEVTIAHTDGTVPLDQSAPWPDVECCPKCGADYPDDLGAVVRDVHQARRVAPEEGE